MTLSNAHHHDAVCLPSFQVLDLSNPLVTTTGLFKSNLVINPGVLQPGSKYTFTLSATSTSSSNVAQTSVTVFVNRPPYGGTLILDYPRPALALKTSVTLRAISWTDDDPSDLPLRYTFYYAHGLRSLTLEDAIGGRGDFLPVSGRSFGLESQWVPAAGNWTLKLVRTLGWTRIFASLVT